MSAPIIPQMPSGNLSSIENLKGRNDPEAIKAVAKEMESLFAYELIKAMRKTISESSKNGLGGEIYTSLFDMELAKICAERGLGIKEMLLRNLDKERYIQQSSGEISEGLKNLRVPAGLNQEQKVDKEALKETIKSTLPVDGKITSEFGLRTHPIHGSIRFHHGVDIAAPRGSEIYPIGNGNVIFSGQKSGYGNIVIIDHGDGILSKYAHNESNLVKEGDQVTTDTVIARVGNTGKSTGSHLHFEIVHNGRRVNPLEFVDIT